MSVPTGSASFETESIIPTSFSSVISATPTSFISNATSSFITSTLIESPSSTSSIPEAAPTKIGPTDVTNTYREAAANPSDIGSQFTICICAGVLIFLVFCFSRTRVPVLFAPRRNMKRHKPPELPTTFFGWIVPLLKIGDEEMLENVGLDALLMLKFVTMCIKIFGICSALGLIVFIPLTMTADYSHLKNATAIDRVSISVIQEDDNKLIAYLIFSYIFTFITFFFLNKSYHEYIYLRSKFLLKQAKMMVSRSIVVTGIPQHLRSDQALSEYYENLDIGPVESCYVVREVHRLNTMIKKRAHALIKLEEAYATYWGNPCKIPGYDPDRILDDVEMYKKVLDLAEKRTGSSTDDSSEEEPGAPPKLRKKKKQGNTTFFKGLVEPKLALKKQIQKSKRPTVKIGGIFGLFGTKVDAIEYYTKLFDDLDKTVSERRRSPYFEMTNVAFVTFEHMSSAIIASQIAINPEPFNCRASMACEPRDVLWDSVAIRGRERILREVIIWSVTVFLCLTWSVPVVAISSLFSLQAISRIDSNLADILDQSEIGHLIFGSFVPTVILNIVTSVLPIFFDTMGYYQGLRSRSAVAESTLSKYYFFLVSLTLIFYSVTVAAMSTVLADLSKNIQEIPTYVANSLSKFAPFFINYTILQAFLVMPLNILLLGSIIIRGFYHLFICSTPREHAENRAPWAFNYGIGYPAPLLIFTIVFEYSLINPVILLFGTVYFCFTYVVYKYQFLYVYFRPYEAAGKLWTMVIPRMIFTLILFQLTMTGIFLLKKAFVLGGLCVPLIGITFLFRFLLNKAYERNGHNLPMQLLRDNLKELPNGSENDSDSEDGSSDDDSPMPRSKSEADIEDAKAKEAKMAARNRWKKAAHSAANLKAESKPEDKSIIVRPRHKKLVLDEDDYEATPDRLTDYRQPPMQLNPGLLDAGLKRYGNPLLVGVLPQLWLPVKVPVDGEQKRPDSNRRKSDLLHNRISGGGNLAQHLAEILRKVEADNKAEENMRLQTESSQGLTSSKLPSQQDDIARAKLIEDSKKIAQSDAASIVHGKPKTKINVLQKLFKTGALKKSNLSEQGTTPAQDFKMKHIHDDDDTLDSVEKGQRSTDAADDHSSSTSSKSVHQTYYHHPDRRKSHAFTNNHLPLPKRPEYRQSNLSAPVVVPDIEDNETIAADIVRPDTQNSRHSSAPLLSKMSNEE
ncbi:hypothetical protein BDF21DRAFT_422864 [Thamnidium elegans]|uniref:DUF221-domain-containing protein n=1 Tax=Thamnidium elegans TaxID=101142 RepID=A0A8H7SGI2_9FUNG|nr:hypothetical protein INT48_003664 [Thamnidium elegans]KAI8076238.1 hypothetical protein BDF21DRAFT_422864 [Thamnidium elegans]